MTIQLTALHYRITILLAIVLIIISCKKNPDNGPYIRVTPQEVNLPAEFYGRDTVTISSNISWRIIKPADAFWIDLSTDTGSSGTTQVFIRVTINPEHVPRVAILTVQARDGSGYSTSFKVNQSNGLKIHNVVSDQGTGGSIARITGYGFSNIASENTVTINNQPATVQVAYHQMLDIIIPQSCGAGDLIVKVGHQADTFEFIYKWTGLVTLVAGSTAGYQDGDASTALFNSPGSMSFDQAGNLYVVDATNHKIRKISPSGQVSTLPGRVPAYSDPSGPNTSFRGPIDVVADNNNNIYVVESIEHLITRISPTGIVSAFAGGNNGYADGVGTSTGFSYPGSITSDQAGNLYVADAGNSAIRKITPGGWVTTFAGGSWGYQDGTATNAKFKSPTDIRTDVNGNLYVCDYNDNRIRKITSSANVTTIAGTGWHGGYDGDALTVAQIWEPTVIATAPDGKIFFITSGDTDIRIRFLNTNGKVESIYKFVQNITGTPIQLNKISGLAVDANNILHFSDSYNNQIYKLTYR